MLVTIPSFRQVQEAREKSYTVYCIELTYVGTGEPTYVERRYSEFYELNKKLQKLFLTKFTFPPKRVKNKARDLLEYRRKSLQSFLQEVVEVAINKVPSQLVDFLNIQQTTFTNNKQTSLPQEKISSLYNIRESRQKMLVFSSELFLYSNKKEVREESILPNMVVTGCLRGIYY